MKILVTFLCFWFGLQMATAQTYYVTFIKGKVQNSSKKDLKVGDALKPEDKLYFSDQSAKVTCISSEKGRYEISMGKDSKNSGSAELIAVLKNKLIPLSGTYKLSSRSIHTDGNNPVTYFSSNQTANRIVLILDQPIQIGNNYPLSGNNIFFLQFNHGNGQMLERLQKKDQSIFFTTENTKVLAPGETVDLCFATSVNGKPSSRKLSSFIPVFMTADELKTQIKLFKTLYPKDEKGLKTALTDHFYESIGKIDESILSNYITLSNQVK